MRGISLKAGVGIIAFILGIAATAIWFIEPFSISQTLDIAPPTNVETETEEEYAVYSVVIDDLIVKDRSSVNSLVISNQTSAYDVKYLSSTTFKQSLQNMKQKYTYINEELLLDYEAKQTRPFKLYPNFNLPVEYILIDANKLEKSEGYESRSMIRLSKVGFNKEKNQALIYIEFFCGMCGFGNYVILEKENDIWKIRQSFGGWLS